jgi:hypothetical protein
MRLLAAAELLEVRCRRCSHESLIDLTEVVWPRARTGASSATGRPAQPCSRLPVRQASRSFIGMERLPAEPGRRRGSRSANNLRARKSYWFNF